MNIFGINFWHPPVPDGRGRAIRFYPLAAQGIPLLSLAVTGLPARRAPGAALRTNFGSCRCVYLQILILVMGVDVAVQRLYGRLFINVCLMNNCPNVST
jgi:hypothetical protein